MGGMNDMNDETADAVVARALDLDADWLGAARSVRSRIAREIAVTEEIARVNTARAMVMSMSRLMGAYPG